jgi:tetratricopeptide (TPR) repeat protein
LREAIVGVISAVPSVAGFFSVCLDKAGGERVLRLVEPLTLFGPDHVAAVVYMGAAARVLLSSGREHEAELLLERASLLAQDAPFARDISEARRRGLYAGAIFPLAVLRSYKCGDEALQFADKLDQQGIRLWAMVADQLRQIHYAGRGEMERAREFQEKTELHVLQGGTTWQTEIFLPAHMSTLSAVTEDVLALRKASEQLARQAKEIPALQVYGSGAYAGYLAARGNLREAHTLLTEVTTAMPPKQRIGWAFMRTQLARVLYAEGDYVAAKQLLEEITSRLVPADYEFVFPYCDALRHLAIVESGLGNHDEAVRILAQLLAKPQGAEHPLWRGLLHKARAQVALSQSDRVGFQNHLSQMEKWFRGTRNPHLVRQWERLAEAGTSGGLCERPGVSSSRPAALGDISASEQISRLLAAHTGDELILHVLKLIVRSMRAQTGHLYLKRGDVLELVAADPGGEPSAEVQHALRNLLERKSAQLAAERADAPLAESNLGAAAERTETMLGTHTETQHIGSHLLVVIVTGSGSSPRVVGGIAFELRDDSRLRLPTEAFEAIARVVTDSRA